MLPSINTAMTASATGNPRNKVALKPGRSLMDWIRLTNGPTDLSGVGGSSGSLRDVTLEELSRHNTKEDAWLAIRGFVYNVTAYFEYHPGGEDELLRGVGMDATDLFDQVHKWVNYESMLKKCLVGRLRSGGDPSQGKGKRPEKKSSQVPSVIAAALPSPAALSIVTGVTTDWMQSPARVTIVFYTRQKGLEAKNVSTALEGSSSLRVRITNADVKCWEYRVRLFAPVDPSSRSLTLSPMTGKVELSFAKVRPDVHWQSVGTVEPGEGLFRPANLLPVPFRPAILGAKIPVTHNAHLFEVKFPLGHEFYVPVGWHVQLKLPLGDGNDVVRSYTPVTRDLSSKQTDCPSRTETGLALYFLVKIYQGGPFTSMLDRLVEGDAIQVSEPMGTFDAVAKLRDREELVCLAAGTGITPMIRPMLDALTADKRVWLVFFNRTRKDIIWEEAFRQLQLDHPEGFKVWHVLSEPDDEWTGLRGRISPGILSSTIQDPATGRDTASSFVCVCGPSDFTLETCRLLDEGGYKSDMIHAFSG